MKTISKASRTKVKARLNGRKYLFFSFLQKLNYIYKFQYIKAVTAIIFTTRSIYVISLTDTLAAIEAAESTKIRDFVR